MKREDIKKEIMEVLETVEFTIRRNVDSDTQERVKKVSMLRIMQILERELNEFIKNSKR